MKSITNPAGQKNKFVFSVSANPCLEPAMQTEWMEYGSQSLSLAVLEKPKRKETQTEREFSEDIGPLLEIWLEKYRQEGITHGTDH